MLRLAPTRIALSSSDTEWHAKRSQKRLSIAKDIGVSNDAIGGLSREAQSPRHGSVKQVNGLLTRKGRRDLQTEENPIYNDEPVPRDSQAFWDQVLVEAGTAVAVHQSPLASSPPLIDPSGDFLENSSATRPSVQSQNRNNRPSVRIPTGAPELLISPSSPVSDADSEVSVQKRSFTSPLPLPFLDDGDESRLEGSGTNSPEELDLLSLARESDSIDHAYATKTLGSEETQTSSIHQMDLDGPSDSAPNLRHYRSTSSLLDPERGSIGMPFGAQARKAELAASRNVCSANSTANLNIPYANPASLDPSHGEDAVPTPSQHVRTQSGGAPRSRLVIPENAAASSPERQQAAQAHSNTLESSDAPEVITPPHRPKRTYRRRSQTYPYTTSVDSTGDAQPVEARYSTINPFSSSPYRRAPQEVNNYQRRPLHNQYFDMSPAELRRQHEENLLTSPQSAFLVHLSPQHISSHPQHIILRQDNGHPQPGQYPTPYPITQRKHSPPPRHVPPHLQHPLRPLAKPPLPNNPYPPLHLQRLPTRLLSASDPRGASEERAPVHG
ncbi:MAG: hypothetical protein Q9222_007368 [Ikaeria aurantiellina]